MRQYLSAGISLLIIAVAFAGCLSSSDDTVKGAEITHIEHDVHDYYEDLIDSMTLYIENRADSTIYNVKATCIEYKVNGVDWTDYIRSYGRGIDDSDNVADVLYPNVPSYHDVGISFERWRGETDEPHPVASDVNEVTVTFRLEWDYKNEHHERTQTLTSTIS